MPEIFSDVLKTGNNRTIRHNSNSRKTSITNNAFYITGMAKS